MLDSVVSVVVADNLDLGCTVIERAATDKAVRDVDKLLQEPYEQRAKARAQGKQFADATPFHGRRVWLGGGFLMCKVAGQAVCRRHAITRQVRMDVDLRWWVNMCDTGVGEPCVQSISGKSWLLCGAGHTGPLHTICRVLSFAESL